MVERNGAPPLGMTDEELVVMLSQRDPASEVVDFPLNRKIASAYTDKPITKMRIQILTATEKIQAKQQAGSLTRDQFKAQWGRNPTADDMQAIDTQQQFDDFLAVEILHEACRTVSRGNEEGRAVYGHLFRSPQWMRDNLTSQELGVLFTKMTYVELERGCIEQVLDSDTATLQLWQDRLKAGLWKLDPLGRLASADLAELVRSYAKLVEKLTSSGFPILDHRFLSLLDGLKSRLETLDEERSSSGEQPENSSPTTISEDEARELAERVRSLPL